MLKFLKMMVAEDGIITEEVLVVLVVEEVLLQEEKETSLQDVKVQAADLEATEVRLLEKVVLEEEVSPEVQQHQEPVGFQMRQDVMVVLLRDQPDVLKVLVMPQEKEDQEEVKSFLQSRNY